MMTKVNEDGTIVKNDSINPSHCAKYLDWVSKILKDKTALFVQTGAIAKEPEKLHVNIKGENKSELRIKVEAEERSVEEIQKDIMEKLKYAKTIQ